MEMIKNHKTGGIPIVSVCVPTYNCEPYIKRAIESILTQKCNYDCQVVVSDDCSTDRTGIIIGEYQKKFPDIIKVLTHDNNVGMHENLNELVLHCKSKYIAKLEGDDYWTDENKLQKQLDFLENNDDFVACAHNVHIVDEFGTIREDMPDHFWNNYVFTIRDYSHGYEVLGGHTASQVYRNIFLDMDKNKLDMFLNSWINEDQRLNLYLAIAGKKMIFSDYMANWMVTRSGANWTNTINNETYRFEKYRIDSYLELEKLAASSYNVKIDLGKGRASVYINMIKSYLKKPDCKKKKILKEYYKKVGIKNIGVVTISKFFGRRKL